MQLGFVIDHGRCIGCHACTVACKSENDVPLGSFRTWVKYTETGTFPQVRRDFAVLRCNQCSDAPCVTICPTVALTKRSDGIVDVDPDRCIGCKSCMQACPYDALYIHPDLGTAQKCHFCAHRTEQGLAPACAVVCPTEAIIPGDFDDPQSRVSQLMDQGGLEARKPEAGTRPNVFYREAAPAGLDPGITRGSDGWLWANQIPTLQTEAESWEAMEARATEGHGATSARTVYDVQHPPLWGRKVSGYLFTKSLAAGAFLASVPFLGPWALGAGLTEGAFLWALFGALAFLAVTTVLLVGDLKRPERFLLLLRHGNPSSWLVRGAWILMAFGTVLGGLAAAWLFEIPLGRVGSAALLLVGVPLAALAAMYTGWLFRQAKGRPLWMRRGLPWHFLVQAWVAGCAWLLLSGPFLDWDADTLGRMRWGLVLGLTVHALFLLTEGRMAPPHREREFARAQRLIHAGPFATRHWIWGIAVGIAVPLMSLPLLPDAHPITGALVALMALIGLAVEEDILVQAGQALPIH